MIPYSLHVALYIAIFLAFYRFLLLKETFYQVNRIVLLLGICFAFCLPLMEIPQVFSLRFAGSEPEAVQLSTAIAAVPQDQLITLAPVDVSNVAPDVPAAVPLLEQALVWLSWAYWTGVVVFGINMLVQFCALTFQMFASVPIRDGIFRIIELDKDKAPCSFANTIFINPAKYDWETYSQILQHEKIHIKQMHSLDLLIAELMLVFQWFNPLAWLYRKNVEINLEFLTDQEMLESKTVSKETYQLSLVKVAIPNLAMNLTTNYNQSLLKKRMMMMNSKKSNLHSIWKYLTIVPVLALMISALNKPVAMGSDLVGDAHLANFTPANFGGASKGTWIATVKDDKVQIEFKSDDYIDRNYRFSYTCIFQRREFSQLPNEKQDFEVNRESGSLRLNGKFEGNEGFGRFKFIPNKNFESFLAFKGLEKLEDEDYFSFFTFDVKKQYIQQLNDAGFKHLSKNQILSLATFKVDAQEIDYWRKQGFVNVSASEIIALKSKKIDSNYINEIRKAGYADLTVNQLIEFKNKSITGAYIRSLERASKKENVGNTVLRSAKASPSEIVNAKVLKIDTNYLTALRDAGMEDLSAKSVSSLQTKNISPEFVKAFNDIGFRNLSASQLNTLWSQGITPELVLAYQRIGLANISTSTIYTLKTQGITPEFIKAYFDIGWKDVPLSSFYTLKTQGLSPAFIKSYQDIGLRSLSLSNLVSLKSQGISAAYIKAFQDIGLRELPLSAYPTLKSQGITPEFIKGYLNLGYTNIPYQQYSSLKSKGITPEYIAEMKKKGFESRDVNKYIQLKTFN